MLDLRRNHRDFDLAMEVATLLPRLPHTADMQSIEADLGITRESLTNKLNKLGKQYRITYKPGSGDMGVGVGELCWDQLQRATEQYYTNVYGEDQ